MHCEHYIELIHAFRKKMVCVHSTYPSLTRFPPSHSLGYVIAYIAWVSTVG